MKLIRSRVISRMYDKYGKLDDWFECENFLTEFGEAHLAQIIAGSGGITHMGIGTMTGADQTSTELVEQRSRQALDGGTPLQGTSGDDNDVTFSRTFAASDPAIEYTFTEAGLFTASSGMNMVNYIELSPGRLKETSMSWALDIIWTIGAS